MQEIEAAEGLRTDERHDGQAEEQGAVQRSQEFTLSHYAEGEHEPQRGNELNSPVLESDPEQDIREGIGVDLHGVAEVVYRRADPAESQKDG